MVDYQIAYDVGALFAIQIDALLGSFALRKKGGFIGQVAGAEALPNRCPLKVGMGGRVPDVDVIARANEILASKHFQRFAIDGPSRNESSFRAVSAHDPHAAAELMIHQERKLVAVTAKRAESVGNADEAIAANGIADG